MFLNAHCPPFWRACQTKFSVLSKWVVNLVVYINTNWWEDLKRTVDLVVLDLNDAARRLSSLITVIELTQLR